MKGVMTSNFVFGLRLVEVLCFSLENEDGVGEEKPVREYVQKKMDACGTSIMCERGHVNTPEVKP